MHCEKIRYPENPSLFSLFLLSISPRFPGFPSFHFVQEFVLPRRSYAKRQGNTQGDIAGFDERKVINATLYNTHVLKLKRFLRRAFIASPANWSMIDGRSNWQRPLSSINYSTIDRSSRLRLRSLLVLSLGMSRSLTLRCSIFYFNWYTFDELARINILATNNVTFTLALSAN